MPVRSFEDLVVWRRSRELCVMVYRSTTAGPFARDFGLRDQIRRASVSVMSNIAEGFGRYSRAEMRNFIAIARGSVFEVQSQVYLASDLGYLTAADAESLHAHCREIARMLAALRASLGSP
ncbi:four helix bundle protein [Longimicrobium terrae]|uniref:Four helix bundle protein n=1 Tax=Longimicrobium terrae TaxID=1639882 RepID=A0A841GYU9_9BACT|nr:four helix bundle protein [Longimicrobium terrae]MBB4636515.1 four helix bundle protein [Longimicrobium terrae]MBB6070961.1 four helix bundle protein [Longimicrobium terrae]NNC28983.1 four helix bundle protein [Longimicrobium terrae]